MEHKVFKFCTDCDLFHYGYCFRWGYYPNLPHDNGCWHIVTDEEL